MYVFYQRTALLAVCCVFCLSPFNLNENSRQNLHPNQSVYQKTDYLEACLVCLEVFTVTELKSFLADSRTRQFKHTKTSETDFVSTIIILRYDLHSICPADHFLHWDMDILEVTLSNQPANLV